MAARTPLSSRPVDLLYCTFFLMHVPISIMINWQLVFPPSIVPSFIREAAKAYADFSADPLVGGVLGHAGESENFVWLRTFFYAELFFQVPVFILGVRGLWKDSPSIYLLLLIYGASATTAILPFLTVVLSTPITSAETIAGGIQSVTEFQRFMLLLSYIPFLLLPFSLVIDMSLRIGKRLRAGEVAAAKKKGR